MSTTSSSTADFCTVDGIPTIEDLYKDGRLESSSSSSGSDKTIRHDATLNAKISIWRGDITKLKADMIVNAANKSLLGGGGVDGAIHRAAGSGLLKECKGLNGAETGETKVTRGYDLPAKYIAHTVGPIYSSSKAEKSAKLLESCYRSSLERCVEHGGGSIGFSSISTGVYGYPIEDATHIALDTTRRFLLSKDGQKISRVIYVVFSKKDEEVYHRLVPTYFPGPLVSQE